MDQFVINRNGKSKSSHPPATSQNPSTTPVHNTQSIDVYTDGACIDNGKPYARAGYGVWFGENDPRNVSESYKGKQTNNIAELLAIIKALTILDKEIKDNTTINIYSDSRYSIRCCTTYGEKCYKKNWVNPNNKKKLIPNLELVQTAYLYCKNHKNVVFHHVEAHTNRTDRHSVGNDHADRLANKAVGVDKCPYANANAGNGSASYNNATEYYLSLNKKISKKSEKRIYLNVPYNEKEEAKKLGAKWESSKKSWYILENNKCKELMMGRW
jgi:ribonuclease HI